MNKVGTARTVRALYKQMLQCAARMPEAKRAAAMEEVRVGFRANLSEPSQDKVAGLLKVAQSRLSYLHIVTPRRPKGGAATSYLFTKDGLIEGRAIADKRTLRAGLDSDDVARHQHLLERQHFGHRR